ncbi:hypothetical protein [Luteococcus sp. OSA5]|uniref:hypothetical protein n=1 Tax=Luteococcus sp. OSA5 TaxID=3401630 RepID=UPI003B42BF99
MSQPVLPSARACIPAAIGAGLCSLALLLALASSLLGGPRHGFLNAELLPAPGQLVVAGVTALATGVLVACHHPSSAALTMVAGLVLLATLLLTNSPVTTQSRQGAYLSPDRSRQLVLAQDDGPARSTRLRLQENQGATSRYWTLGCSPEQQIDGLRWLSNDLVEVRVDGITEQVHVGPDGPLNTPSRLRHC